jgi:hypothetical protein
VVRQVYSCPNLGTSSGDDPYDYSGGDEPYLELVRDSLKLIKAESISYELGTDSIHFYERTTR